MTDSFVPSSLGAPGCGRRGGGLSRLAPSLAAACLLLWPLVGAPSGCQLGGGQVQGDVTVDTQVRARFVLFSFDTEDVLRDDAGEPLSVEDPSAVSGWDLALSQWVMATNSGDSASAGSVSRGALLAVEGTTEAWASLEDFSGRCSDFVAIGATTNAPSFGCGGAPPTVDEGYVSDAIDDPDGAGPFPERSHNASLSFWFEYRISNHEVVPYGHVYVVETNDGRCVKMQLTDYYDASGENGLVSFSWDWLPD